MTPPEILRYYRNLGVEFWVTPEDKLHVEDPDGTLTDEGIELLRTHRDALIAEIRGSDATASKPTAEPAPWMEPPWFRQWMLADDARRLATLAAAMERKTQSRREHGDGA